MGAVSNVLPAQRGLYVVIGAKLSRFQSRLRVYNIYGVSVCVRVCVRVCVHACLYTTVCACVCSCVCVCSGVSVCVCACVYVCACLRSLVRSF